MMKVLKEYYLFHELYGRMYTYFYLYLEIVCVKPSEDLI